MKRSQEKDNAFYDIHAMPTRMLSIINGYNHEQRDKEIGPHRNPCLKQNDEIGNIDKMLSSRKKHLHIGE